MIYMSPLRGSSKPKSCLFLLNFVAVHWARVQNSVHLKAKLKRLCIDHGLKFQVSKLNLQ